MKILLPIITMTFIAFSQEYNQIPNDYKDQIKLTDPKNNLITLKNEIDLKGRVKNGIEVYINDKPINLNRNGQFKKNIEINSLGKQTIKVKFKTKDKEFLVKKDLIKLKNPKNIIMTQKELGFINTPFVSNKIKEQNLTNKFKKNELAYFLDKLNTNKATVNQKINNINKITNYKDEIQRVINSEILSLNKRKEFEPFKEVSGLTLITGIARALNYDKKIESVKIIPELKKHENKWYTNYLVIALNKNIIQKNEIKNIKKPLSNADFVKYASRIPEIQTNIVKELTFKQQIKTKYPVAKQNDKKTPTVINIKTVKQLSKTTKLVVGNVTPRKTFTLNWRKINPDESGNFSVKIPIKQKQLQINFGNELLVKELPKIKTNFIASTTTIQKKQPTLEIETIKKPDIELQKKQSITPYEDLTKHWISKIANELKLEGKLDNTNAFNPNKEISRADLAKYIVKINGISPKSSENKSFSDLKKTNPNYAHIQNVISNKLLNGISKTKFSPETKVTKLQAIIVASRLLPESDAYENVKLPYKDIKNFKWAEKNLKKAYYYKIISNSTKLNPKKSISNAELVSILYKTSKI